MRILLVQPAPFENGRIGLENALWMSEPAGLTAIAAMVRDHHEVRILDMRLEKADALPAVISSYRPEVVGVTSMTTDAYQARAVAYCAHAILGDDVFTIVGGHHPSLVPEQHAVDCIDAVCIGEGEETFAELVEHLDGGGSPDALDHIPGLAFLRDGELVRTPARSQARELDTFPAPARDLLGDYSRRYFFGPAVGMASLQTSRGCAYDCSFCAIWEFYERKVRFLSAKAIVDRMEQVEERFVMFLDDNFLSHRARVEELADELERRRPGKFWMAQGRTDFVAQNPDLMRRLRDTGLMMILSGYETNDDDALESLRKDNTRTNNIRAAEILNGLGIWTTGIFMVRPEWEEREFDALYASINEMKITAPLVVVHTPLPGTQDHLRAADRLLTRDMRLYDLLHAVVPTRLPREEFYRNYARWNRATMPSSRRSAAMFVKRPRLALAMMRGLPLFLKRLGLLRKALDDGESYLRDEYQILSEDTSGAPRTERSSVLEGAAS